MIHFLFTRFFEVYLVVLRKLFRKFGTLDMWAPVEQILINKENWNLCAAQKIIEERVASKYI
ncbi:MAG: hypothetical protein CM15mP32_6240 [Flavobacteriaceae bacterium]|nr:MAG: hypothetical protein CM15mP32_6240 [Flavobacteriaceae bacterium]